MRARRWWSCPLALAWLVLNLELVGAAEGAEPRHSLVTLEWTRGAGAETCLSESELIEDVELALGRHAFTERSRADRVLRAQIRRSETSPRWQAQIALSTPRGRYLGGREITIDSADCNEASESLVLALALMIDLPEAPEEIAERRKSQEERWHMSGALGPSAAVDSSPSFGGHAAVVVAPPRFWPVVADAFVWIQSESGAEQRSFSLAHTMLGLGLCPLTVRRVRLGLSGCIGPQAELVTGWGTGFAKDRGGLAATFGGLAQASVTYLLGGRVRAFATLGVAATPQRIEFTYLDEHGIEQSLHRTSPVKGVGAFGLAIDFF